MLNEITKVNFDTIREAAAAGESITVIINGEYYDIDTAPAGTDPETAICGSYQRTIKGRAAT